MSDSFQSKGYSPYRLPSEFNDKRKKWTLPQVLNFNRDTHSEYPKLTTIPLVIKGLVPFVKVSYMSKEIV